MPTGSWPTSARQPAPRSPRGWKTDSWGGEPAQFGKPLRRSKHGLWRYRVRDYRLVCRLEHKVLIVVVVAVGHRSTIYED